MKGEKGKIVALFAASVGAGISLGPMIGGIVGQYLGTQNIFLTFIPLFVMLLILAFVTEARNEKTDEVGEGAVAE
jgi:MFS family permease